jgi:hypothetical protein
MIKQLIKEMNLLCKEGKFQESPKKLHWNITWRTRDHKTIDVVESIFTILFPLMFDFDMVHIVLKTLEPER